ncbi:unnamed protein product [Urochloa decumbens]|uniref:non-specific serine/threonine protein kinase n=2 Tax=Urochloa decumbens TaxID=240449 RepID=A0ABC9GQK9_9POAL
MIPFFLQCFLLLFFFPASGAEEFIYNGFANADLSFEGEASMDERGRLGLTTGLDTGGGISHAGIGHAFYRYPVSFRNNPSDPVVPSFTTTFVFETTTSDDYTPRADNGSDGLAFVISSSNKFLNESLPAQYLGLFNMSNRGSRDILAIELGDIMNPKLNSIDDNQVAVNINSFNSTSSSTAGYYYGSDGHSGFQAMKLVGEGANQLWVEYDGNTQILNVTLASFRQLGSKPESPLLSSLVNLSSLLTGVGYIGFSASTSIFATRHYILGWSFKKNGEARELNTSALEYSVGGGGNNYDFGPPASPLTDTKHARSPSRILLPVVAIPSFFLLAISAVLGYIYNKRQLVKTGKQDWEIDCGPPSFTYKDLHNATNGFKDEMFLGRGGFGRVYKGLLPATKQNVAIKRISPESKQGMKEFISEITILGHVRHRRVVNLLGYCRHKRELLLVYDYMPNGSLDKYLYGQDKPPLCWSQRFNIIKDVASGLFYLHEEWERVVIHRDIKSSNVLLDDNMNGRLGDFGLARLHDHGVDAHTTHVAGTCGYIAPELARLGKATKATDIFAFGVFMLEVTCGRRPIEMNACGEPRAIADCVINAWQNGSAMDFRDPRVQDCVAQEVESVLKLGLLCSHPSPKVRPGMRLVMQYLESVATLPDFPLNFFNADPSNDEVCDQFVASCPSVATATISLSGGR